MNETLTYINIQSASQVFGQISETSSPHQNKEKFLIMIGLKTFFRGTAPTFIRPQSFRFPPVRTLKISSVLSSN